MGPWKRLLAFYRVGSYMGIPVVLALLFFTFNLVRTMRSSPAAAPLRARRASTPPSFSSTLLVR